MHSAMSCALVAGGHICGKQPRSHTQGEEEKLARYKARNRPN